MPDEPHLPTPPRIALTVTRERPADSRGSRVLVDVRRVDMVARYPDGSQSAPFAYDLVTRTPLDAAIVVAYERRDGERYVYLRTATRVPLALHPPREGEQDDDARADLWEIPGGLVEPGESPRHAAARELEEELGFRVAESELAPLGPWTLPLPALVAERQHYFAVDVTGRTRSVPTEDGTALERGARIAPLSVRALLAACRAGELRDAKSELAIRRVAEVP